MSGSTLQIEVAVRQSPDFPVTVSLDVPPGFTMLFGASGSGKTTLLRAIAGLVRPDAGRIALGARTLFDGARGIDLPPEARRVGLVFQHLALFPHLTLRDNLAFGLHRRPDEERRRAPEAMAERFRIAHLLDRRPAEVSGGERQRAAVARALVTRPDALLLDEPLAALDHATQTRIMDDLRAWQAEHGTAILYVTHSHREVYTLGARVVAIESGRVVATGTPHEVLTLPGSTSLVPLAGVENLLSAVVAGLDPRHGTMDCTLAPGCTVEAPSEPGLMVGAPVHVAIRAGDLLLAVTPPDGLSARNVWPGTVVALRREGPRIVVHVDIGTTLVAHVTSRASEALHLVVGRPVWVIAKTHSCRVLADA